MTVTEQNALQQLVDVALSYNTISETMTVTEQNALQQLVDVALSRNQIQVHRDTISTYTVSWKKRVYGLTLVYGST